MTKKRGSGLGVPAVNSRRSVRRKPPRGYEPRLVLFLDFLGFGDLITRSEQDPEMIRRITHAIDQINFFTDDSEFSDTQRLTQFSDSLVVSFAIHERSAVFTLINDVAMCLVDLVDRGFLLRGAITAGPLIHTARYLFGPAMVRAYEMESQFAKYPRVLVDREVFDIARKAPAPHHSGEQELEYVKGSVADDSDGQLFIDYVSYHGVVVAAGGDQDEYPVYLGRIAQLVKQGFAHQAPRVKAKYLWLYDRYLAAIKDIEATPAKSDARYGSPEFFRYVAALPRFREEAKAARREIGASEVS